jgi:hypothetical protein
VRNPAISAALSAAISCTYDVSTGDILFQRKCRLLSWIATTATRTNELTLQPHDTNHHVAAAAHMSNSQARWWAMAEQLSYGIDSELLSLTGKGHMKMG